MPTIEPIQLDPVGHGLQTLRRRVAEVETAGGLGFEHDGIGSADRAGGPRLDAGIDLPSAVSLDPETLQVEALVDRQQTGTPEALGDLHDGESIDRIAEQHREGAS